MSRSFKKHKGIEGWRKIGNWRRGIKGLLRELGMASASGGQKKQENVVAAAKKCLIKASLLRQKLAQEMPLFPISDETDLSLIIVLEHFMALMGKHIGLVDRRILKG